MDEYSEVVLMAAKMKECKPEKLWEGLRTFLDECADLTAKAGGELVSRQSVAVAIVSWESMRFPKHAIEKRKPLNHDDH